MAKSRGQQHEVSCPPLDEVVESMEVGAVYIDHDQLLSCAQFFDSDPNVVTGFNFRLDALLNGGIIFKRKGLAMTGPAHNWIATRFSAFLKEVVRWWWLAGFAACVWEKDQYGGSPLCLDLTQLKIAYEYNIMGTPKARYFVGVGAHEKEIHHVQTFFSAAPDCNGKLRSIIRMLASDHTQEALMTYWTLVALKGRALPVMVTEQEAGKYDPQAVQVPTALTPAQLKSKDTKSSTAPRQEPIHGLRETVRRSNYESATPLMDHGVEQHLLALATLPHFSSSIQLPQGQRMIQAHLPEAPSDLIAFRVSRQERAFTLMGVPLAMVTNATSTGSKHQQGENSNAFILFDNAQAALKQQLIAVAKQMFYTIHLDSMLSQAAGKTDSKEQASPTQLAEAVKVEIEIPSIPNDEKLEQWFAKGWLKYDALIQHLSSKHGISPENFEKSPMLSVKELAGQFEDPPEKGGGPAKKKAKTTT